MPPNSYDQFVNVECRQTRDAYLDAHGHEPDWSDQGHTAWRRLVEGWTHERILKDIYAAAGKPFPGMPDLPAPIVGTGRTGVPRGNTYQFVDDTGGWLPWGQSLFWANYGFLHERERLEEHLNVIAGTGADYIRVILTGLRKGPTERSVSPKDPKFQEGVAGLLDLVASYGMRTQLTIFGATYDAPSSAERLQAVDKVCEAVKGREPSVMLIEIANEGWTNGFVGDPGRDELTALVARVADKVPTLVSPTCPAAADDVTKEGIGYYYKGTRATVQGHHYARKVSPPDGFWRHTKKPWRETTFSVDGCCSLVTNQEPMGPESSGAETNDPRLLAVDAAVTWLAGVGAYVLHCGAGIYGLADPSRDRPADLWETENYEAICRGIQAMRDLLPPDLPNWTKHKTNHVSAPFGFVDTPDEQLSAAYSATSGSGVGQRIVIIPYGIVKPTTFTLRNGRVAGTVHDPRTGAVLETFDREFHTSPSEAGVVVVATRTE